MGVCAGAALPAANQAPTAAPSGSTEARLRKSLRLSWLLMVSLPLSAGTVPLLRGGVLPTTRGGCPSDQAEWADASPGPGRHRRESRHTSRRRHADAYRANAAVAQA